jgi:ubiquinone/menaquinone biosynthesis C-methylase UbiE
VKNGEITMNNEKHNFDKDAASWDAKPERVRLVKNIAQSIIAEVALTPSMDVMDFGCGTGILIMQLQPLVHCIMGVDSSQGMLDVLKAKIRDQNLENVQTCYLDVEKGGVLQGSYNMIVSSMTLHHIREIKPLLNQFHNILRSGGYLCIADLDSDDGQFHENNSGVFHEGFDREKLACLIREAGFRDVRCKTAVKVTRPVHGGESREFTIFLITGCRVS